MYWGVGRECRYSQARRGIVSIKGHWESPRGVGDVQGLQVGVRVVSEGVAGVRDVLGVGSKCRYSGARRGIGGISGIGGS